MTREIARIAFHGMNSNEEEVMKACLEKIWIMTTEKVSETEAEKIMNDSQKDKVKADGNIGKRLIEKYGTYKGHSKFQLALDFFQMSNDRFFEIYKFNFVPHGELAKAARDYIAKSQLANGLLYSLSITPAMSANMSVDMRSSRNIPRFNDTFRMGG